MKPTEFLPDHLYSYETVAKAYGVSRSTLERDVKAGRHAAPVAISRRRRGFRGVDVLAKLNGEQPSGAR